MKLFAPNGEIITASKIRRPPQMSWKNGRCWDYRLKTIDGRPVKFHYETGYGTSMYFTFDGCWFRARFFQDNDPFDVAAFTSSHVQRLSITDKEKLMKESPAVTELRVNGNPLLTLINIVEALHPIQTDDSRLGYINMPELIAEARGHLNYIADGLSDAEAKRLQLS